MKRLIITALLLSLASCLHAQITENRSIMVEGFISGCKKHKDIQIIYEIKLTFNCINRLKRPKNSYHTKRFKIHSLEREFNKPKIIYIISKVTQQLPQWHR
jgi:hypothetical protein